MSASVYDQHAARVTFAPSCGNGERIPFRSALEARWSRLFERLALRWAYEPETFDLPPNPAGARRYRPDFHVEGVGWVEVKPTVAALMEVEHKLCAFASVMAGRGERVFSLTNERPGFGYVEGRMPTCVEWFAAGVCPVEPDRARGLFATDTGRELMAENPGHYADYLVKLVEGLMFEDVEAVTLGERLFAQAVADGGDFDTLRVAYLSTDPGARFAFTPPSADPERIANPAPEDKSS